MIERLPPVRLARDWLARRVERPEAYYALQRAVGSTRVWRVFLGEHLRPQPGLRVLDIGCGPAEVVSHLPPVDYLGIDPHAPYVEAASARFGARARFRACEVATLVDEGTEPFDVVLLLGLLHHVSDADADHILASARALVRPGGRLLTLDGCHVPGESRVARFAYWADRGGFTRDQAGYEALVRPHFPELRATVHTDLLRLPYAYLVLEAAR